MLLGARSLRMLAGMPNGWGSASGVGMERMSRHQELKWSTMWGPGAWKSLLEVLRKWLWTNCMCSGLCFVSLAFVFALVERPESH